MFDLAELYAMWTEDSNSFWGQPDSSGVELQERLALEPQSILDEDVWSQVLAVACPAPGEYTEEAQDWLGTIVACLRTWSKTAVESGANPEIAEATREALEKYFFLTRLHLARLDTSLDDIVVASKRSSSTGPIGNQIRMLMDAVSRTVQGGLASVFPATASAKRSTLALLYLEPSCRLLQREIVVRDTQLSREIVRLLSLGVKLQHQQAMVRTQLLQLLTYYEHAVPVVVQLLDTLQKQFDHVSLTELVLKDLASEASEWTDSQNSATITRAKCVNAFLQALTQSMPQIVAMNLAPIAILIKSPVPQLRQAVLDIAAPVIHSILAPANAGVGGADGPESNVGDSGVPVSNLAGLAIDNAAGPSTFGSMSGADSSQYKPAFDLIKLVETRVDDVSHFCRLRAVQALASVASEPALISCRERFTEIAVSKMKDRTQLVRKQAMRLMKQLIDTHPQVMHAGSLSRPIWQSSLDQINAQLDEIEPGDTRQQLEAAQAYVSFTLRFIDKVDDAITVARMLLLSRSKSDILDAVDLLVYADAYAVESSAAGIRAMVHLVWAKADNDESNTVCQTVVTTYHELFMTAPPEADLRRGAQIIADNLIALTRGATHGELTSLERLLVLAVEADYISVPVVSRLWGLYQTQSEIDPDRRRGAAILLSMLSRADRSIACSGIAAVAKIGLGSHGKRDFELAAYSCAILKHSIDTDSAQRLPPNYELFELLISFLLIPSDDDNAMKWTFLAKEALMAVNVMCDCSPVVYTRLIRQYAARVFDPQGKPELKQSRMQLFAQLLFLVGEVALNLLVYLERSELEFKRKSQESRERAQQEGTAGEQGQSEQDKEENLMAGGGSSGEDDFQDVLRDLREDGILYSDRALLKPFTRLVVEICEQELDKALAASTEFKPDEEENEGEFQAVPSPESTDYNGRSRLLTMGATQTLSKLMCVSSRFCADCLPLLVRLMSSHPSNVVRSNFVVALGDVAICFNRLIDQHTEYLYDRLNDKDSSVQRTCIVALTFLILAGQIKVKGKLGEMAKAVAHPNRKISALATMFFRELATKENAVYNSFLDMLSTLISDATLAEHDMLRILKFLAEFIDKDKQMKQLTEKIVARLPRCDSKRQWNAYVQVLKSMPRKLDEPIKELIAAGFTNVAGQSLSDESDEDLVDDPEGNLEDEGDDPGDNAPGGSSQQHNSQQGNHAAESESHTNPGNGVTEDIEMGAADAGYASSGPGQEIAT